MKDMTIQALSVKERSYRVLDSLSVGIGIKENRYSLPPESIFSMAARNNPNRSYLFVSKLIGKHIPVCPPVPFIAGFLLASRLAEALGLLISKIKINEAVDILSSDLNFDFQGISYSFPGRALFIGFAETATALGHSVFSSFTGDISFLHTTRENIKGTEDTIYFTEEHCHAPDQRCLIFDASLMQDNDLLVLVDDEITSGNTCLNIIKTIQKKYPQKKYAVLTILDWRSEKAKEKYCKVEQELGIQIDVISLLEGVFWSEGDSPFFNDPITAISGNIPEVNMLHPEMRHGINTYFQSGEKYGYLGLTGRFGMGQSENHYLHIRAKEIGQKLSKIRKGKKSLCLGTGEFMYIPFLISRFMGEGIMVQSTTRSPVHPHLKEGYAVKHAITFYDPFRQDIKNFVYNIPPDYYDEVFVFWERKVLPEQVAPLVKSFEILGISNISFVSFCN
ncbi:MAG: phosphoribosyltransferase family protein [Bacillota bacterium]